jgi:hypothetical protein
MGAEYRAAGGTCLVGLPGRPVFASARVARRVTVGALMGFASVRSYLGPGRTQDYYIGLSMIVYDTCSVGGFWSWLPCKTCLGSVGDAWIFPRLYCIASGVCGSNACSSSRLDLSSCPPGAATKVAKWRKFFMKTTLNSFSFHLNYGRFLGNCDTKGPTPSFQKNSPPTSRLLQALCYNLGLSFILLEM